MRVFMTGGSGFVGSAVTRQLIERGHTVTGLARSDASAAALEATGAAVLRGDLKDLDALAAGARSAEGVIHCGFIHDFTNFAASVETDRYAITALGEALAGTGRPFLVTSGIGLLPQGRLLTEDDDAVTAGPAALRGASDRLALEFVARDVRVGLIRLPPSVHGDGDHGLVPIFIGFARKAGVAAYVGSGENRWSAVHRDDAAGVYVRALENGAAGARYHAVADQGSPFRDIVAVIGRKLGVPTVSISPEEAADRFGEWLGGVAQFDVPALAEVTRERLGWQPTGPSLLDDLEHGTYFAA